MQAIDYIVHETERQSGTMREAVGMYDALCFARANADSRPWEMAMKIMAGYINGQILYRKVPAVFNQGRPAVSAENIPRAMKRLFDAINDQSIGLTPEHFTREFLEIHPFADGNGRVGSLLWNWLRGSLMDPEPMPYFFGEGSK